MKLNNLRKIQKLYFGYEEWILCNSMKSLKSTIEYTQRMMSLPGQTYILLLPAPLELTFTPSWRDCNRELGYNPYWNGAE